MADTLLQRALQYKNDRGWNVIPLAANAKVPAAGFPLSEFFGRQMTDAEMQDWFNRDGVGNVGVIVGPTSGLWVVDIDDLGKVSDWQRSYPSDLMSRTPSGGIHLFYQYPDGLDLPNGHIGEGVDVFGRDHYVLVAPSYVKDGSHGSRVYSGSYEWVKYGKPSRAPQEVIVAALTGSGSTASALGSQPVKTTNVSRQEALNLLGYAMRHGKFFPGRHNETIYYGSLVLAGDGMHADLILEMMLGFDGRDDTPQGERQVRVTVGNAIRAAQQAREAREAEDDFAGVTISISDTNTATLPANPVMVQPSRKTFNTLTYDQLAQEYEGYEAKWMVQDWLMEDSVIMFAAPPERFKTWAAADLALSVCTGLPFLGQYPVRKTGDVLVIQQEDFGARLISRFSMIENAKARLLDCGSGFNVREDDEGGVWLSTEFNPNWNTIHFHTDASLKLDDPKSLASFKDKVRELKPALVIIDPFYSLSNKTDDYYASLADTIRQHIKELRNEVGCSFVFVHHTGKGNKDGNDPTQREGAWGSQFVNAAMEGMVMFSRQKGQDNKTVTVFRRFKDAEAPPVINVSFIIKDGEYSVEFGAADSLENDVKMYLLENGPTELKDLFDEFGDKFSSKPQLTNWLREVDGIVKEKRGVYTLAPDVRLDV